VIVVVLVAAAVLLPAMAFATTGDVDNPAALPALPWTQDATGTLMYAKFKGVAYDFYEYNYVFPMAKGQTVSLTSTMQDSDSYMFVFPEFNSPVGVDSVDAGPGMQRLTFMAPSAGDYDISVEGSQVETFSVSATSGVVPSYALKSLVVPKSAKKNVKFKVSVKLSSLYDSFLSPIKFVVDKWTGKKWKLRYSTTTATIPDSSTTFPANIKLPKGKFRIHAIFADVAHAKPGSDSAKTVTVK
jgi:hypothetical protein